MHAILIAWLAISGVSVSAVRAEEEPTGPIKVTIDNLATAPKVSPVPDGMPDPRVAPDDGMWKDDDGTPRPSGTFLQAPLDGVVLRRMNLLDRLPMLFQTQLNELKDFKEDECQNRLAVTKAHGIATCLRGGSYDETGWSTLEMIGAFAIGVAAGAVAIIIYYETR